MSYFPKIDKWLEFAVNTKVKDLCLKIGYTNDAIESDQLQSARCSSSIVKLKCENCRILDDCVLNWKSL